MKKTFDELSKEEIIEIAKQEFSDDHKLILSSSGNWIVKDIDDYISYGNIRHTIVEMESVEEFKEMLSESEYEDEDENENPIISNHLMSNEEIEDLIKEAESKKGTFYFCQREHAQSESDFSIENNYNEALAFVSDVKYVEFIEDEEEIVNKYAEEYLRAGYMENGRYSDQRTVIQNYFDVEELVSKYQDNKLNLKVFDSLNDTLNEFVGTEKTTESNKTKQHIAQI